MSKGEQDKVRESKVMGGSCSAALNRVERGCLLVKPRVSTVLVLSSESKWDFSVCS